MNNSLITFFVLALLMSAQLAFSQDLHIFYDVQTNQSRYEYKGKTMQKPKVKRGGNVFVHIENFNNYLYDLEVKTEKQDILISTDGFSPFTNALSGDGIMGFAMATDRNLPDGATDYLGLQSGINEGYKQFNDMNLEGFGFGENAENLKKVNLLKQQFDNLALEMVKTEKQLQMISSQVEEYKEAQIIKYMALAETEKLKYNPTLQPAQIKKLSTEYLQKALEVDNPVNIDLSSLMVQSDGRRNLREKLDNLDTGYRNYQLQVRDLASISSQLEDFVELEGGIESFYNTVNDILNNAKQVEQNSLNKRNEVIDLIGIAKQEDLQTHAALRYAFEAISTNDFKETYQTTAETDELSFDLKLRLKDSVAHAGITNNIQMAGINVPVFGGLKVNASVGISFGQFFNRPKNYFVRDSSIFEESQDSFYPFLTSVLHFYPQSAGIVAMGGSIGIGLPIASLDGVQSATFFVGPCLIFGKSERIVVNLGMMGGRIQRLAQGFEVGDTFYSDADNVPIHYPYELGAFLGLSFNLVK